MDQSEQHHVSEDLSTVFDVEKLGLAKNYTILLNKLEKLAFAHNNDKQNVEEVNQQRSMSDAEYSRFISDVWIGVVLTLLILSIVFFICSCFLYHKFQQWKNTYRTNSPTQAEVIRRYDLDVESLPSYTVVSGLPSYDDALEQFRKAGIIIQQPSVIKIFEDVQIKSSETSESADNVSVHSCTCCAAAAQQTGPVTTTTTVSPVIELSPEQLKILSQKRLSLQIALNSSVRHSSHSRIDLCREVNRSNLFRSHEMPQIHRSTSSLSSERNFCQRLANSRHRGSLA